MTLIATGRSSTRSRARYRPPSRRGRSTARCGICRSPNAAPSSRPASPIRPWGKPARRRPSTGRTAGSIIAVFDGEGTTSTGASGGSGEICRRKCRALSRMPMRAGIVACRAVAREAPASDGGRFRRNRGQSISRGFLVVCWLPLQAEAVQCRLAPARSSSAFSSSASSDSTSSSSLAIMSTALRFFSMMLSARP